MDVPLFETHRHFCGSISSEAISKITDMSINRIKSLITFKNSSKFNYENFFKKFELFDNIEWTYEKISKTIQDVIWGIKHEQIEYTEIKFSVNKYLKYINSPVKDLVLWFANEFDRHCSIWGVNADLILCLKHDMDKNTQLEIASIIKDDTIAECISGIDVVGNEKFFDPSFYKPIFKLWHDAGKSCIIHVGEIDNKQNVLDAINILNVDRICHGIAAANDKEIAKKAKNKQIAFDISLTSNIYTGVVKNIYEHPIKNMIDNGFIINIGTDDPQTFSTTLDKEYFILQKITGMTNSEINKFKLNSVNFNSKEINKRKCSQT
jgi:adenosine deaminase